MFLKTKSSEPDLFFNTLVTFLNRIEKEQVNQRLDLHNINILVKKNAQMIRDVYLQGQATEYYGSSDPDNNNGEKYPEELPKGQTSL